MTQRGKSNPFSFFSEANADDEDIFKDFDPGPPSSARKKDPPKPPKITKEDNPFSFFQDDSHIPPSPSASKPSKKKDDFFDLPSSVANKSKNKEDSFFDAPPMPKNTDDFFDEPDPLPTFDDLPFPELGRSKIPDRSNKFKSDEPPRPPLQQNTQRNSEIEKYKRAAEKAEAMALGYEEKLKQANKTIEKMRQKEKQDEIEMENALRLIERKLAESQKRVEQAEDENERLQKIIKKLQSTNGPSSHNHHQCTYDWQSLHEKTSFAVGSMSQMATQSETHINGLISMAKDFQLLMETFKSLGNISSAHQND